MYTVGRIGSYITRGVSTVSGPFHPFGGAVDIIVVEQPDGSFKSSPWYVRFGKFQGVLKAKENIVKVGVNGVDTDFYMYLDQRGEAYFLREAGNDAEELEAYTSSSSGDEMDRIVDRRPSKSNSFNFESRGSDSTEFGSAKIVEWTNSRRSRILGHVFGRRSLKADSFDGEDGGDPRVDRVDSLERAEIAADLLEMRWCTNIPAKNYRKDGGSRFGASSTLDSESKVDEVMAGIDDKGVAMSRLDDSAEHILTDNVIDEVEPESTSGISGPTETNYLASNENISGAINISTVQTADGEEGMRLAKSLPYLRSQHGSFEHCGPDRPLACSLDSNYKYLEFSMQRKDDTSRAKPYGGMEEKLAMEQVSRISRSEDPSAGKKTPSQNFQVSGLYMVSFGSDEIFEPTGMIAVDRNERTSEIMPSKPTVPSGGNWRWPFSFKKSQPRKVAKSVDDRPLLKTNAKNMARAMTPASDQLSSLNLKEGCNSITFTFCTAMLGKQQVDARIYLWKWNTRVIISDVDGTITKSDVLGQFMPWVGMDWSQTGVAHLYSAIKENGYQLLFLSARAISQAYYTRQFLFKLKQDGKSLPDGPVVISPDGLFPSLYREVIRRAPHEFKIATLQDIRDLFPADHNPFYAGFGNRNTDEISYLKVGIPQGKIFTINPKGEIAVNKHINTKSYTTLHALVNGMFPPIASFEQEDFNSWNYWKIPPPDIDI